MMTLESLSVTQSHTKIIHRFWQLLQLLPLNIMLCEINLYRTKVTVTVTQVRVKCLKNSG